MVDIILGLVGTIIYPLFSIFFVVIDLIQYLFTSFAGIGTSYVGNDQITNNGPTIGPDGSVNYTELDTNNGIVYYLLRSSTVQNLFYSLLLLAIVLLVFFTILAFIKNMYSEKPKSWKDIIVNSIKGLASFVLTPVICLFGVWIGNILLQALYSATSPGGWESMSREVFVCAAYDANRFRNNDLTPGYDIDRLYGLLQQYYGKTILPDVQDGKYPDLDYLAELTDNMFRGASLGKNTGGLTYTDENGNEIKINYGGLAINNIYSWTTVANFYNPVFINYILLIVGSIFMLYALGAITFGAIKRLFYLVFLFVLSPIMNALYPWDEGSAAKGVMKDFYKHSISVYSSVVGLNLFFAILPLMQRIDYTPGGAMWSWSGSGFINIASLLLMICGLLVVKDLIGLIDGYIGTTGVYASGSTLMKSVKGQVGKIGKGVGKTVGAFSKASGAAKRARELNEGKGVGAFFSSMTGTIGGGLNGMVSNVTGIDIGGMNKARKDGLKEGREAYDKSSDRKLLKKSLDEEYKEYQAGGGTLKKRDWKAEQRKKDDPIIAARNAVSDLSNASFDGKNDNEIIKIIQGVIDKVNKLDDEAKKVQSKQLMDKLKGFSNVQDKQFFKGTKDLDGLSKNMGAVSAINSLDNKYKTAEAVYKRQATIEDFVTSDGVDKSKFVGSDGRLITDADTSGLSADNKAKYKAAIDAQVANDADPNKIKTDANISAESMRQFAVSVGEQLVRALQSYESTINGNQNLEEFADKISQGFRASFEEMKSKGGKQDDSNAEVQKSIKDLLQKQLAKFDELKTAIKEIKPNGGNNNNGGSGGT